MSRIHILTQRQLDRLIEEKVNYALEKAEQKAEDRLLVRQMQISMLQAQMNPHFLYNTLECIRGQAIADGELQIAEATHALSNYYRYNISNRRDTVSVKAELDNVENYMKIQQYRFQGRFSMQVDCDCDERILTDTTMPKLSLQPLIENAIIHGFQHIMEDAQISIRIVQSARNLNITVSDNGEGIDEETLVQIRRKLVQNSLEAHDPQEQHGIAMINVNRRIVLMFGEQYGLTINSIKNAGTDVELHIPCTP